MPTTTNTKPLVPAPTRRRPVALAGLGFVVAVLVGNSLTGPGSGDGDLAGLTALAGSTAGRVGLVLELLGFVLLLLFVAEVAGRARRGTPAIVGLLAGGVAIAVKVSSAAAVLGAMHRADRLDEVTATAVVADNDVAFVLFWIGFGLFVAAAALALPGIGGGWRWTGLGFGSLAVVAGVLGAVVPDVAVPVPFLLCLAWTGALSARLALAVPGRADSVPVRAA